MRSLAVGGLGEEMKVRKLRLGPIRAEWKGVDPHDDGCNCDGEDCGLHKAGCIYGGFSDSTSYWLIAENCPLYHGEDLTSTN